MTTSAEQILCTLREADAAVGARDRGRLRELRDLCDARVDALSVGKSDGRGDVHAIAERREWAAAATKIEKLIAATYACPVCRSLETEDNGEARTSAHYALSCQKCGVLFDPGE